MMLWRRLGYLLPWRRRAAERDMRDELQALAKMAAPGELGNLALVAEDARAEWGWTRLDQTFQDVRYAVRTLARRPGFTATAVLSLALGIGVNTALFTLVDAITWRMLPIRHPETLLLLGQRQGGALDTGFSYRQYQAIRDHSTVVDLAAYGRARFSVTIDGRLEPGAEGEMVSGDYFRLLGVAPAAGRAIRPEDDRVPLGHPVAMLSYGYWKRRFALDPLVIGRALSISGTPFTIIGVTPPEFFGVEVGSAPDLFVSLMMQPAVMPVSENLLADPINGVSWLRIVGRLADGVSAPQAHAALAALAPGVEWRPRDKRGVVATDATLELTSAATGLSDLRTRFSTAVRILVGVAVIVLLIACASVGNLLLARSVARRGEFALRLALGASRSRLIRQVLVEGLILSGIAAAGGIALAHVTTRLLLTYVSVGRTPVVLNLAPDGRMLTFTASVSVLTALLFASVPAFRASRLDSSAIKRADLEVTRHRAGSLGPVRWLVVSQVALSLLLLITGGLFARSLHNLQRQDVRADRDQILIVRVEPRGSDQRNVPGVSARLDGLYRDLIARVERLPGVQSATLARSGPLEPLGFGGNVTGPSGNQVDVRILMTYPKYFSTMGVDLVSGRDFTDGDLRPGAPLVAIANETFVRQVLEGRDPLQAAATVRSGADRFEIIGVVRDSRLPDLRSPTPPMLYQTFLQTRTGRGQMVLHVKVTGSAASVIPEIRQAVQAVDKDVPVFEIQTLADELDAVFVQERLVAALSGFFGLVALTLVCVGLYGLMSFTVTRRTAEIGIRVALGAATTDVSWMIARQTLTLVLAGIAAGLPIAFLLARLAANQLSAMLFQLAAGDPLTVAAAAVLLILVAMGAGLVPARRAARIDPIVALRSE